MRGKVNFYGENKRDAELSFRVLAIYRFLGWAGGHHYRFSLITVGVRSIATDCTSTVADDNIGQIHLKIN